MHKSHKTLLGKKSITKIPTKKYPRNSEFVQTIRLLICKSDRVGDKRTFSFVPLLNMCALTTGGVSYFIGYNT